MLVLLSVFLTRPLVLGILFSNLVNLALKFFYNSKLLVSILSSFATNLSYTIFLTTSFFTRSLNLLKSTGTGTNLSTSNLSTLLFKLAKFVFNANLEVST